MSEGKSAIGAKKRMTRSERAGLVFPVARIDRQLRDTNYDDSIKECSAVFLAAVLEYLIAELVELGGNEARNNKKVRITPDHLKHAIYFDAELSDIFEGKCYDGFTFSSLLP